MAAVFESLMGVLPQLQCQECGYPGCAPYAKAMIDGESISLCIPGGSITALQLSNILQKSSEPWHDKQTQTFDVVSIDEAECIGCTKCIEVCPTDAIVGAAKWMHSIITNDCTGCGLCLPVCPVDCMHGHNHLTTPSVLDGITSNSLTAARKSHFRARHEAKLSRRQPKKSKELSLNNRNRAYTEDSFIEVSSSSVELFAPAPKTQSSSPQTLALLTSSIKGSSHAKEQSRLKMQLLRVERQLQRKHSPELTQQLKQLQRKSISRQPENKIVTLDVVTCIEDTQISDRVTSLKSKSPINNNAQNAIKEACLKARKMRTSNPSNQPK